MAEWILWWEISECYRHVKPSSTPFYRGRFRAEERNVPSGEERGETDVFAGYKVQDFSMIFPTIANLETC